MKKNINFNTKLPFSLKGLKGFIFILLFAFSAGTSGQALPVPQLNLDDLFFQAQDLAFEQEGASARELCLQILDINPDYHDASILMARTLAWEQRYEEASEILQGVISKDPSNKAALLAMTDVQAWAGNYKEAIEYLDKVIIGDPTNPDLLFRKAQMLNELGEYQPTVLLLHQILDIDPTHRDAKLLLSSIEVGRLRNFVGIGYRGDYFEMANSWHLFYAEYGRRTNALGTVISRVNVADRFGMTGLQFEVDAYPTLGPGTYMYLNAGYSPHEKLFPIFRAGLELFQKLPAAWEISAGLRLLNFAENDLLILTGSLSKYYKKYYFSFRPFYTLASNTPSSQSYFFTVRRYFSSPDHHLSITAGTGFSADDDALIGAEVYNLESNKVMLWYQQKATPQLIIRAGAGYQHYKNGVWGNKYSVEAGVAYLF
jgi:YaiO family outer membrane protein